MRRRLPRHQPPSVNLSPAIEDFLADCRLRGLSPTTLEWYRYALQPFARFALAHGEATADALTDATVRAFLSEEGEHVQPRRVDHYRQAIDRLYKWLIAEGRTDANPAAQLRKIREPRRLVKTFSEAELEALLAQPDIRCFLGLRDHVFMLLLLDTGIRLSEALGLCLHDLDLPSNTMRVLGKGDKERLVGFTPALEQHLRRCLVRREMALAEIARSDSAWVFPNQFGDRGGDRRGTRRDSGATARQPASPGSGSAPTPSGTRSPSGSYATAAHRSTCRRSSATRAWTCRGVTASWPIATTSAASANSAPSR
jgi:integrase/recombinase XerD